MSSARPWAPFPGRCRPWYRLHLALCPRPRPSVCRQRALAPQGGLPRHAPLAADLMDQPAHVVRAEPDAPARPRGRESPRERSASPPGARVERADEARSTSTAAPGAEIGRASWRPARVERRIDLDPPGVQRRLLRAVQCGQGVEVGDVGADLVLLAPAQIVLEPDRPEVAGQARVELGPLDLELAFGDAGNPLTLRPALPCGSRRRARRRGRWGWPRRRRASRGAG